MFISNLWSGINLYDSNYSVIHGNILINNEHYGIDLEGATNCKIVGNTILGTGTGVWDGIYLLNDSNYNIIQGNTINSAPNYGIEVKTVNCLKNIITGNVIRNNTTGAINDLGTGTEIGHNITS